MVRLLTSKTSYQKERWQENSNKIIRLLNDEPLTFKTIIEKSGLSRSVVNGHLKELEKEGIIKKEYRKGKVVNVLQTKMPAASKEKLEPVLFAAYAQHYVLGVIPFTAKIDGEEKVFEALLSPEKEKIKDRIELTTKRLGVFYVFSLLKALEERNFDWVEQAKQLDYGILFDKTHIEKMAVTTIGGRELTENNHDHPFLIIRDTVDMPEKKEIEKFKRLLKQIYPEEVGNYEKILFQVQRSIASD
jgi:DNA-binding transcriptional ArsR family regulator